MGLNTRQVRQAITRAPTKAVGYRQRRLPQQRRKKKRLTRASLELDGFVEALLRSGDKAITKAGL